MLAKIRDEIRAIPKETIQKPLMSILELLEIMGAKEAIQDHEDALRMSAAFHGPDEMQLSDEDLELETLEVENDYVQQNLPEDQKSCESPKDERPSVETHDHSVVESNAGLTQEVTATDDRIIDAFPSITLRQEFEDAEKTRYTE